MHKPNRKRTVLPGSDEILDRLGQANVGLPSAATDQLYPIIAKKGGGKRIIGEGVYNMLILSIAEYVRQVGVERIGALLIPYVTDWIRALVDDPDVLADALHYFETSEACKRIMDG